MQRCPLAPENRARCCWHFALDANTKGTNVTKNTQDTHCDILMSKTHMYNWDIIHDGMIPRTWKPTKGYKCHKTLPEAIESELSITFTSSMPFQTKKYHILHISRHFLNGNDFFSTLNTSRLMSFVNRQQLHHKQTKVKKARRQTIEDQIELTFI